MMEWRVALAVVALAVSVNSHSAELPHSAPTILAPGYFVLEFPAPVPGSYQLPPLRTASDGEVLDDAGNAKHLYDYFGDRVVLLSFIYTACSDVNGCPLAAHVLKRVQDRAMADPNVRDQLRIVSVSFDPQHDRPAVMAQYGAQLRAPGFDWVFLTGSSDAALKSTLEAYDQSVYRDDSGAISHILRVVLIDKERRVRNIYSVSFLHADTVLSDVQTLLLESGKSPLRTHAN